MTEKNVTAQVGDPRLGDWFWREVTVDQSGCWVWSGRLSEGGYGYPYVPVLRKYEYTHRLAYAAFVGELTAELVIDHLCRNRTCCNPAHLELVTQRENIMRSPIAVAAINAAKTHCDQGHEFTEENTYRPPAGGRECRACKRERENQPRTAHRLAQRAAAQRRYYARQKAVAS